MPAEALRRDGMFYRFPLTGYRRTSLGANLRFARLKASRQLLRKRPRKSLRISLSSIRVRSRSAVITSMQSWLA